MRLKTVLCKIILCLIVLSFTFSVTSLNNYKLSPAFDVISNELKLVKTGRMDSFITFTAEDFDSALGRHCPVKSLEH